MAYGVPVPLPSLSSVVFDRQNAVMFDRQGVVLRRFASVDRFFYIIIPYFMGSRRKNDKTRVVFSLWGFLRAQNLDARGLLGYHKDRKSLLEKASDAEGKGVPL